MKFSSTLVGLPMVLACLASGAAAETIAIVNGKAIPSIRLEALENNALVGGTPAQQQPRADLVKNLVELELASQEFDKLGLASDALFQSRLELTRQEQILQKLVFDYVAQHIPSDADIQAAFEKRFGVVYRYRHKLHRITVGTEALAKDAIMRLNGGETFEELAKQMSIDGDAQAGGDMGWQPEGAMLEAINLVVKTLKPGEITQTPVRSPLGFHVIRLDEVGTYKVGPQGKEKQKILEALVTRLADNYLKGLRAKADIEQSQAP